MGQDRESESNPQPKYIGPDNQWAGYPYKPFYIIYYNKNQNRTRSYIKSYIKKDSIFGPNSRLFSLVQNIY